LSQSKIFNMIAVQPIDYRLSGRSVFAGQRTFQENPGVRGFALDAPIRLG
jgi:hypothetical protein